MPKPPRRILKGDRDSSFPARVLPGVRMTPRQRAEHQMDLASRVALARVAPNPPKPGSPS